MSLPPDGDEIPVGNDDTTETVPQPKDPMEDLSLVWAEHFRDMADPAFQWDELKPRVANALRNFAVAAYHQGRYLISEADQRFLDEMIWTDHICRPIHDFHGWERLK